MPCSAKLRSCVNDLLAKGYPEDSAWAICKSQLGESMNADFVRILNLFTRRYGEELGAQKFDIFVQKNELDTTKLYNPKIQFQESFEWIEPLIKPYKQDKEAKYYLVTALTADISMNNVDYGPEDRLAREDSSMNWRPVNLNHDHSKWLPYPRTRVDFSAANEFSLEATLRVDNRDAKLQQMLDNGEIMHPSIEGRPHPISGRYHFTGLALLEKGVELPGSPLSEIVPLVFNESVGRSICEFKDGKMVCECSTQEKEVKNILRESIKTAIKEVLREQTDKPIPATPEQSTANAEKPPKEPEECPTGFHWDGQQCVPNDSGDSAKSPMTKLPGPKPALYEYEVQDVNPPDEVNKRSTATCPPNQHMENGVCVPDAGAEAGKGWHVDPALQKAVPDNPQVNEQIDKRLADTTLRLENEHLKEENIAVKQKNDRLQLKNDTQTKAICNLEGENKQLQNALTKKENQNDRLISEKIEDTKTIQKLQYTVNDKCESYEAEKTLKESVQAKYDKTVALNQTLGDENVKLKSDLTDARTRELQWNKDKTELSEGLAKALKHQKYVYEFLKSKGFDVVAT